MKIGQTVWITIITCTLCGAVGVALGLGFAHDATRTLKVIEALCVVSFLLMLLSKCLSSKNRWANTAGIGLLLVEMALATHGLVALLETAIAR